jgi:hypothetical protein
MDRHVASLRLDRDEDTVIAVPNRSRRSHRTPRRPNRYRSTPSPHSNIRNFRPVMGRPLPPCSRLRRPPARSPTRLAEVFFSESAVLVIRVFKRVDSHLVAVDRVLYNRIRNEPGSETFQFEGLRRTEAIFRQAPHSPPARSAKRSLEGRPLPGRAHDGVARPRRVWPPSPTFTGLGDRTTVGMAGMAAPSLSGRRHCRTQQVPRTRRSAADRRVIFRQIERSPFGRSKISFRVRLASRRA